MIIPSIDLEAGRCVQLIGGEELAIDAGSPFPVLEAFSLAGEVAVVDLDAARGIGSNRELMRQLCARGRVRVGGGIRTLDDARQWLDAGAAKIVIGTAAEVPLLQQLPRERTIVALDTRDGAVLSHGWRQSTGRAVLERIRELRPYCAGFLVTFVELEGRQGGTDLEFAQALREAAPDSSLTIAGGVTTPEEVAALDRLGAEAQVGMALYSGRLSLADAIGACLVSDREDGLWPTVIVDEAQVALGLAYSDRASLRKAIDDRRGVYHSRKRGLWTKGSTSGATQELLAVDVDCDRDCLRFTVRQSGAGFCHQDTRTCWGADRGLGRLERRLWDRMSRPVAGSVTNQLLGDPDLLAAKIREEAQELCLASSPDEVRHEAADLLYFTLVRAAQAGVRLEEIEAMLDTRELRVSRRACVNKEQGQ